MTLSFLINVIYMNKPLHFIITAMIIGLPSQAICNLALTKNVASAASIGTGAYGILKLWRTRKDRRPMPRKVAQLLANIGLVALGAYGLNHATSAPKRTARSSQPASQETEISQVNAAPPVVPINDAPIPSPEETLEKSALKMLPIHQTPKSKPALNKAALPTKKRRPKDTNNQGLDPIPFPQLLHTPPSKETIPPHEESRSTGLASVDLSESHTFKESDQTEEPLVTAAITAHAPSVEHPLLPEIVKKANLLPGCHTPSPRRSIALATQSPAIPSISTSPVSISAVPFPSLLTTPKAVPPTSPTTHRASAFSRPKNSEPKAQPPAEYTTPLQQGKLKPLTLGSFKIEGFTEAFSAFLRTTGRNKLMAKIFGSPTSSRAIPNAPKIDDTLQASALYTYEIYNKEKEPISNQLNAKLLEEKFNSFQLVSQDEMMSINLTDRPHIFKIKEECGLPKDAHEIVIWLDNIFEGELSEHNIHDILGQEKSMRTHEGPRPYPSEDPVDRQLIFSDEDTP